MYEKPEKSNNNKNKTNNNKKKNQKKHTHTHTKQNKRKDKKKTHLIFPKDFSHVVYLFLHQNLLSTIYLRY